MITPCYQKVLLLGLALLGLSVASGEWNAPTSSVLKRPSSYSLVSQIRGGGIFNYENHQVNVARGGAGSKKARSKSKSKKFLSLNASDSGKKKVPAKANLETKPSSLPSISAGFAFAGSVAAAIWLTSRNLDKKFLIYGRSGIPFDYPWRLTYPSKEVSAWLGYSAHNLLAWLVIWAAKNFHPKKYTGWSWPNYAMFAVHAVFAVLHIVQTNIWYDGLARDVPEITSLGSVALLLMVVIALENPRRGFVLGKPVKFPKLMMESIKKYHGYLFTWALIYTFWFHPTEPTSGHLWGFFYLYLLLWQSVAVYTPLHFNRKWTTALELIVLPHSVMVALEQGKGYTPMFVFGFLGIFVLTQMYGLDFSSGVRRSMWLGYITSIVATYSIMDRWKMSHEITRIPVATYMVPYLMAAMFWPVEKILDKFEAKKSAS